MRKRMVLTITQPPRALQPSMARLLGSLEKLSAGLRRGRQSPVTERDRRLYPQRRMRHLVGVNTGQGFVVIVCVVLLVASCRSDNEPQAIAVADELQERAAEELRDDGLSDYARDLDNICHSEERSGALARAEDERAMTVAQWLGGQIRTDEGRAFLGRFAQTNRNGKSQLLAEEAARLGLPGCPLAERWRGN